ncbi:MAG: 50S ribosomal protein L6 [Chloroflexi bacterium]|nr:50S ribosomal protein L6 [Chloroflexota bacterium]
MSRIGKSPITLPAGVIVDVQKGNEVTVKGKKGQLVNRFDADLAIKIEDGIIRVERPTDSREHRSLHGLTRSLLNNMVVGVSEGFQKKLDIEGVGYRSEMNGDKLVLIVGYSHPVTIDPPPNTGFAVENRGRQITISGIDKQVVGAVAAQIRRVRPPEPYKGKGIRYAGEQVRRKAGKAGKV